MNGSYTTTKTRLEVYERDGRACKLCGVPVHLSKGHARYGGADDLAEIDHIVSLLDGGTNARNNLQLLCKKCNRKKMGDDVRRRNAARREVANA